MQIDPNPGLRPLAAGLSCVVLVGLSIAFVDRPLATWLHETFHGGWGFVWLSHAADPVLPGSALGVLAAAVAVMSGWRPGRTGRTIIACCLAALLAYAIKDQAKYVFGRLWPETWVNGNPSWIGNAAYGFSPFHGGAGWSAFPSGHMSDTSAPLAVIWIRLPKWRGLAIFCGGVVAVGLLGANYHFLGDVIAGTYLGVACAIGVLAVLHAGWSDRDGKRPAEMVIQPGIRRKAS